VWAAEALSRLLPTLEVGRVGRVLGALARLHLGEGQLGERIFLVLAQRLFAGRESLSAVEALTMPFYGGRLLLGSHCASLLASLATPAASHPSAELVLWLTGVHRLRVRDEARLGAWLEAVALERLSAAQLARSLYALAALRVPVPGPWLVQWSQCALEASFSAPQVSFVLLALSRLEALPRERRPALGAHLLACWNQSPYVSEKHYTVVCQLLQSYFHMDKTLVLQGHWEDE